MELGRSGLIGLILVSVVGVVLAEGKSSFYISVHLTPAFVSPVRLVHRAVRLWRPSSCTCSFLENSWHQRILLIFIFLFLDMEYACIIIYKCMHVWYMNMYITHIQIPYTLKAPGQCNPLQGIMGNCYLSLPPICLTCFKMNLSS